MKRHPRLSYLLACAMLLGGCGGGGNSASNFEIGRTVTATIVSAQAGTAYDLQIYLPPGYDGSGKSYPVIYAMDGHNTESYSRFAVLRDILIGRNYRNVILVAVDSINGVRRYADFAMPGAQAYYRFLTTELIPMIDAQYRTDPRNRTLSGHSLSAEFTLFALYLEQPDRRFFSAFMSADCTCWATSEFALMPAWDVPIAMEQQMFERSRSLPVKLAMSGDTSGNLSRATDVYQRITQHGYTDLQAEIRAYSQGHVPMDGPAFIDALAFVFGPPPP